MLVKKGLADSRHQAQAMIMTGSVLVNLQPLTKPGSRISTDDSITIKGKPIPFVSRGGIKLEEALNTYGIDVRGLVCLDVGASTGGFTDCLLQQGAGRVFAVDVGYGQLAWKLRQDKRVRVLERTNIRNMPFDMIGQTVDVITIDVSFISLRIVVPAVLKFMNKHARIIALIKPQFEVGKGEVGKGGVVKDPCLHRDVLDSLTDAFTQLDLICCPPIPSPIKGPKGNMEFLMLLEQAGKK